MNTQREFTAPTLAVHGSVVAKTMGAPNQTSIELGSFVNVPRTAGFTERTLASSETGAPSNPD
jgi:hypothetical protein